MVAFYDLVGYLGNAFALFFFFSPVKDMVGLFQNKQDVKSIAFLIFIFNVLNCGLWVIYGLLPPIQKPPVYICNSIGTIVNLIYLIIFFWFRFKNLPLRLISILLSILITFEMFFSLFYALNFDSHKIDSEVLKADIIGKGAMIFNIGMYAAPAQNIVQVFKTEDENLIPIHTSIVGFLCSFTWLSYGLLNFDINIVIPNVLGLAFTVFQIVIWIYFWKKKSKKTPELDEYIGEKN